ncbi:hypothetical protein ARMGADRAFT_1018157 [Armillaria gallica]|uniref:Uncharacterized protein n=1 Tax=Armillaria gallica TaxID=47427 RepID=A0A2H3D2W9_ARMGA|nr:hypothetical protein ARMGADRAFT_1018157 [Armillaria gallica]
METVGSYHAARCRNSISILHRAYPSSTSSNVLISSSVLTDSSPVTSAHAAISTLTNLCGLGRRSTVAVILLPLSGFNLDDCRSLVRADAALPRQLWWRMELGELGKNMIRYRTTVYDSIHSGYPEARVLHTGTTVLLSHFHYKNVEVIPPALQPSLPPFP